MMKTLLYKKEQLLLSIRMIIDYYNYYGVDPPSILRICRHFLELLY